MKRKILSALIFSIVIISLTGCSVNKESVLKKAKRLNVTEFVNDVSDNELNATDRYKNNFYKITGSVEKISNSFILLIAGDAKFKVLLPKDDIKKIKTNQEIEVAGKLTNINKSNVKIKNAYLTKDEFTITGKVTIPQRRHLVNFVDYTGRQKARSYYANYKDSEWFLEVGNYKIKSAEKQNFYNEGDTIILGKKVEDGMVISVTGKIFLDEIEDIAGIKIK